VGRKFILGEFFVAIVLSAGCVCCDTSSLGGLSGGSGADETGGQEDLCESPYMQVGSECCLDSDSNGICDSEEETTETTLSEVTETTIPEDVTTETAPPTTTTLAQAESTTTLKTSTTTMKSTTYQCVKNTGYDPDKVIYAYSSHCGNEFTSTALHAASNTGVGFQAINIGGFLAEKDKNVLECFYGEYSQSNLEFTYCPRLLCPKTGYYETMYSTGNVLSTMMGFARKCA